MSHFSQPLLAACLVVLALEVQAQGNQPAQQGDVKPPATCREIRATDPKAGDGTYTLFHGNDLDKPWKAYCHGMAGTPAEYLQLPFNRSNFSQYTAANASQGRV